MHREAAVSANPNLQQSEYAPLAAYVVQMNRRRGEQVVGNKLQMCAFIWKRKIKANKLVGSFKSPTINAFLLSAEQRNIIWRRKNNLNRSNEFYT